jgi:hypothetical protein
MSEHSVFPKELTATVKVTAEQADLIMANLELFKQIFRQQLREQAKTNELLSALVDALAEDGGDPDAEPARYMDGRPV